MRIIKNYWLSIIITIISLTILQIITGSVCLSIIFFGIPCPACGLTRAGRLLLSGHLQAALQMHPLLPFVIFGFLLYLFLKRTTGSYKLFVNVYVIITIVTAICLYIYRMGQYFNKVEPMLYNKNNLLYKALAVLEYVHLHY